MLETSLPSWLQIIIKIAFLIFAIWFPLSLADSLINLKSRKRNSLKDIFKYI